MGRDEAQRLELRLRPQANLDGRSVQQVSDAAHQRADGVLICSSPNSLYY